MKGLVVAEVVYYLMVFLWLLQIVWQGFTDSLVIPTIVLIAYGGWLNYKMRKTKR